MLVHARKPVPSAFFCLFFFLLPALHQYVSSPPLHQCLLESLNSCLHLLPAHVCGHMHFLDHTTSTCQQVEAICDYLLGDPQLQVLWWCVSWMCCVCMVKHSGLVYAGVYGKTFRSCVHVNPIPCTQCTPFPVNVPPLYSLHTYTSPLFAAYMHPIPCVPDSQRPFPLPASPV